MPEERHLRRVVIVSGHGGSGKTTLAGVLAIALGVPWLSKDDVKVRLMEREAVTDVPTSARFGRRAWDLMLATAPELADAHPAVILEGPFDPDIAARQIQALNADSVVEVFCRCSLRLALQRFAARSRHPGLLDTYHTTHPWEWLIPAHTRSRPLGVGPVRRVDTDDFSAIDVAEIAEWVMAELGLEPAARPERCAVIS